MTSRFPPFAFVESTSFPGSTPLHLESGVDPGNEAVVELVSRVAFGV